MNAVLRQSGLDPMTMAVGLRGRMDVGAEAGVLVRRGRQPERVVVEVGSSKIK